MLNKRLRTEHSEAHVERKRLGRWDSKATARSYEMFIEAHKF